MTDFFTYCETADDCDSDFYNAYYFDGWAIGSTFTMDEDTTTGLDLVVALEYSRSSFGLMTSASSTVDSFYTMPVPPEYDFSATSPDFSDLEEFE